MNIRLLPNIFTVILSTFSICSQADIVNQDYVKYLYGVEGGFSLGGETLGYVNNLAFKAGDGDEFDMFAGVGFVTVPINILVVRSLIASKVEEGINGKISFRRQHTDLRIQYRNDIEFNRVQHRFSFNLSWLNDPKFAAALGTSDDFEIKFKPSLGYYIQYSWSMPTGYWLHYIVRRGRFSLTPNTNNGQPIANATTMSNDYWIFMIGIKFLRQ